MIKLFIQNIINRYYELKLKKESLGEVGSDWVYNKLGKL